RGKPPMSLLTFDNPVFRWYAVAATIMIVKMMSQAWITVFRMSKVKGGFRYPEDAQKGAVNPNPRPGQLLLNEYVDRSRRMLRLCALTLGSLLRRSHGAIT